MGRPLFITQHGELRRKNNTLHFVGENLEKAIPIKQLSEIHCVGRVSITSGSIDLLSVYGIPVHFYTITGFYKGSFIPKTSGDGKLKVVQVQHYLDCERRTYIAKQIVLGMKNTMIKALERKTNVSSIKEVSVDGETVNEILGMEAELWNRYYFLFGQTVKLKFKKRTRRPPKDEVNALISYGNSLLYGLALSAIIRAGLDPDISFLHEPMGRRFSLTLDISEPFKPLITAKIIWKSINKGSLTKKDFRKNKKNNGVYLNSEGRRKFVQTFNEILSNTVYCPKVKRNISYRLMLDYEAKKLANHLKGRKLYRAFRPWW